MKRLTILFLFLIVTINSITAQTDTTKYLFMGHIYYYFVSHARVDERVERLDLTPYDGIWLGGDVCSEALLDYSTLEYLDSMFNLKHPNTHWALGNHDARNGNWNWLEELTGKKTYYTSHYKGVSYMVLNPNITPYDCESLNDQYKVLVDLCDTIKNSSHLILLMHHGLWKGVPGLPSPVTYAQSNLAYYSFNCDDKEATFAKDIYPRLVEVQKRGIEVICILGDMGGVKVDFLTEDEIHFLGCGITRSRYKDPEERENAPKDWILEFNHIPENRWMDWKFHDIDSILAN